MISSCYVNQTRSGRIIVAVYDKNNEKTPISIKEFKNDIWSDLKISNCEYLFGSNMIETAKGDNWTFIGGTDIKQEERHNFIFFL